VRQESGVALSEQRLSWAVPLIVATGMFMENLDSTIISTSIPEIARSLHENPLRLNLALTSYLLSLVIFVPISGWVADRFGARNVFVGAMIVFTAGSIACGLSQNLEQLVISRSLQGIGGAMMTPVGRLILLRSVPKAHLLTAMSYLTIPSQIGAIAGPLLGGALTTYVSWRWIFYLHVPIGLCSAAFAWRKIPNFHEPARSGLDFKGFVVCAIGLVCLQLALGALGGHSTPVGSPLAMLAVTGACALIYVRHSRHAADPVLDPRAFAIRTFRIATLFGGLARIAIGAVPFLVPVLLQLGFGYTPFEAGLFAFLIAAGSILMKSTAPPILRRFGFRRLLVGNSMVVAVLLIGLAGLSPGTPGWAVALHLVVLGYFRALQFLCLASLGFSDVDKPMVSRVTTIHSISQHLTMAISVAAATMLLDLSAGEETVGTRDFGVAFIAMGCLSALSGLLFRRLDPTDGTEVTGFRPSEALDGRSRTGN
jgi:EmrB/QacA subfamily drug resistance transporter